MVWPTMLSSHEGDDGYSACSHASISVASVMALASSAGTVANVSNVPSLRVILSPSLISPFFFFWWLRIVMVNDSTPLYSSVWVAVPMVALVAVRLK